MDELNNNQMHLFEVQLNNSKITVVAKDCDQAIERGKQYYKKTFKSEPRLEGVRYITAVHATS
jgi:hypothetical protein